MLSLWDPRQDAPSLRETMNRLFEQSFVPSAMSAQSGVSLDVLETPEEYVVKASLPGTSREKVNVSFEDATLTIQGTLEAPEAPEKSRFLLRERFCGEYRRSVTFPVRVDADKASADYKDGVLTLTLPKSESVRPRTIKIG